MNLNNIQKKTKKNKRKSNKKKFSVMTKKSFGKRRMEPVYKGLGYDMLMAYIYLIKNYKKNLCIAIGDKDIIKKSFSPTYIGLVFERKQTKNELMYPGGLDKLVKFIKNCKKKYFSIPLSIEYPDSGPHFNMIVGNTGKNVIERFEPYGAFIDIKVHAKFDKDFKKFLKLNNLDYQYKNPDDFCPNIGNQEKEETQIQKKMASVRRNDFGGYCGMWGVWFMEMKVKNPYLSSKILLKKSKNRLGSRNYRKFIRNYTNHIIEMRKEIMTLGGVECKNYMTGKSPDYQEFKRCAQIFMDKKLDDFF
tara:strand:+ start:610 stop:1521 length:912 start_codon:yes stop_codon:yes gene_type:complete